jgi:hypothetical protein
VTSPIWDWLACSGVDCSAEAVTGSCAAQVALRVVICLDFDSLICCLCLRTPCLQFKYDYRWAPLKKPNTSARDYPENRSMTLFGEQVTLENKILFDLVNKLDLDLFKAIHKPVCR